ncbi:MAG: cation transporter, partial [Bacilli bacterium]|nr:cation transporter [Bacilli bacterium]
KGKPNLLQMHGFYVDPATKIITFDLIFTFEEKKPADRAEEVRLALQKRYPDYRVIAILDTDYTD